VRGSMPVALPGSMAEGSSKLNVHYLLPLLSQAHHRELPAEVIVAGL
jgi:hypothetical protein